MTINDKNVSTKMEGEMRIITGTAKGRRIEAPEGLNTRPTSDRVKESLFNILTNLRSLNGTIILDLYAGSGNLGLECLSRGSHYCTFIEKDKKTFKILRENIETLKLINESESYNEDAFIALNILSKRGKKYDLIFLDPPYSKGLVETSIEKILGFDLLCSNGIIICEYDEHDNIPEQISNLKVFRTEKYGRTMISFWTKEE
jgi:16S rRNA (guanine(966)-N(2))-methyltransferase RsmD